MMGAAPTDEQSRIVYLEWQDLYNEEKPFQVFANVPHDSTERLTNLVFAPSPPLRIHDLRGRENDFSLDRNGFAVIRDQMPAFDISTKETMEGNAIPYFEHLVKKHVSGVDFVRCFDYGVSASN
jgi:hypothetical protein